MSKNIRKKLELHMPGKRLLLHACCAPCSSAIVECLVNQGIRPVIFYSNSNIFPEEEYLKRRNECIRYAEETGLDIVNDDYCHEDWRCIARGLEHEGERGARCSECFRYRLERAASYAHRNGFDVLATTLASSRWKDLVSGQCGRILCLRPFPGRHLVGYELAEGRTPGKAQRNHPRARIL